MSDLTPIAPPAPLEPPPNRLSILHLMGWTLGSAVILAISRWAEAYQPRPDTEEWFRVTQQLLNSIIYGAAVGSLILVVSRRLQLGTRFPNQPGHWLLVTLGAKVLASWLLRAAFIASRGHELSLGIWHSGLLQFVGEGIGSVLLALALVENMKIRRWKVFFVIALSLSGVRLVAAVLTMISGRYSIMPVSLQLLLSWPISTVVLLVVVGLDVRRRANRDYLHWAGVAASFGNLAVFLLNELYFTFHLLQY